MSFATGLSLGAFGALLVYVYFISRDIEPAPPPAPAPPSAQLGTGPEPRLQPPDTETRVDRPRFDFYTILPETEVNVPDWQSGAPETGRGAAMEPGSYVLQVGSFQQHREADRAKAQLALQGISASIQKVVINGADTWYRVRVGPVSDGAELDRLRRQLDRAGTNFMLLRIKPGAGG